MEQAKVNHIKDTIASYGSCDTFVEASDAIPSDDGASYRPRSRWHCVLGSVTDTNNNVLFRGVAVLLVLYICFLLEKIVVRI